jgi:hypothetical protein
MRAVGGYNIRSIDYKETIQGGTYLAKIEKHGSLIGFIEGEGSGGCSQVIIDAKFREGFKAMGIKYFESIGFDTTELDERSFYQTIAEHLIHMYKKGRVSKEVLKKKWLH